MDQPFAPPLALLLCAVAFFGTLASASSIGVLKGALRTASVPMTETADPLLAIRGLHVTMMVAWMALSGWRFGLAVLAVHLLAAFHFSRLQTGRVLGAEAMRRYGVDAVARVTLAAPAVLAIAAMALYAAGRPG